VEDFQQARRFLSGFIGCRRFLMRRGCGQLDGRFLVIERDQRGRNAPPVVIDESIVCEAVQISRKPRRDRLISACADHVRPDVLKKLFRYSAVAALAQKISIQLSFVPTIQLVERADVARTVSEHQLLVTSSLIPGHHGTAVCAYAASA
jgi:hypothetical protein